MVKREKCLMKRNRFSFLSIRLFHKGEVGGAFVVVIICQRELLQWAVVKRLHTLDVEGVEEMLTTSKRVYARHVDTGKPAEYVNSVGQRNLTDLRRETF